MLSVGGRQLPNQKFCVGGDDLRHNSRSGIKPRLPGCLLGWAGAARGSVIIVRANGERANKHQHTTQHSNRHERPRRPMLRGDHQGWRAVVTDGPASVTCTGWWLAVLASGNSTSGGAWGCLSRPKAYFFLAFSFSLSTWCSLLAWRCPGPGLPQAACLKPWALPTCRRSALMLQVRYLAKYYLKYLT